jgi:hypothetical protein
VGETVSFPNTKTKQMENIEDFVIDEETINKVGLQRSTKQINAAGNEDARVFEYPHLNDVFIMESDLYGNKMPQGSCFLAFYGSNGLIGKHLKIETLRNASCKEIQSIVEKNDEG